jgi:glutamine amidotransferase
MIAIVDYGAGNISSVAKALESLGAEAKVTTDPEVIAAAAKVIVPGVGHFSRCISLNQRLGQPVLEGIAAGKPFLGICVGMQWLFAGSTESPETPGAGLFVAQCTRFPGTVKSPHVGWNQLQLRGGSRLFGGLQDRAFVYYTHSYRAPVIDETTASTTYGGEFSAAIERGNVFGVQFHPEKSGPAGLHILENFCAL